MEHEGNRLYRGTGGQRHGGDQDRQQVASGAVSGRGTAVSLPSGEAS